MTARDIRYQAAVVDVGRLLLLRRAVAGWGGAVGRADRGPLAPARRAGALGAGLHADPFLYPQLLRIGAAVRASPHRAQPTAAAIATPGGDAP